MIVYAAPADVAEGFLAKLNSIIIFPLISLMMGVALLIFLYGCFEFIMNAGNDGAREKGKQHILWGVVGFVVMVSAYTILNIAAGTFGLSLPN